MEIGVHLPAGFYLNSAFEKKNHDNLLTKYTSNWSLHLVYFGRIIYSVRSNSFEMTGVLMNCSGSSPVLILLTNTYCVFTQEFDDDFKQIMVTLEQIKIFMVNFSGDIGYELCTLIYRTYFLTAEFPFVYGISYFQWKIQKAHISIVLV